MNLSTTFIRCFYVVLSFLFMISFSVGMQATPALEDYLVGAALGLFVSGILILLDIFFKRFNLRSFNIAILGLFIGYLMALALIIILDSIIEFSSIHPNHYIIELIKILIFLGSTYLGVLTTLRASNELYISLPFVKFSPSIQQTKDILIDDFALNDPRLIDLALSGLLDGRLVLPRFLVKQLHMQVDSRDDIKNSLEIIKKLETLPTLGLRYQDMDFPDIKDISDKILRLARLMDAYILSGDPTHVQVSQVEGIKIINLHALSSGLKPLMQKGSMMKIKIQRQGKEDRQGIGYLEDGTMVVVNGGGDYIGDTIDVRILSMKHTSSGRIIFCNALEETEENGTELS